MEKITLQRGEIEAVEINGTIVGLEIVEMLRFLQLGIETESSESITLIGKDGIECCEKDYDDLVIFLASEAGNIEDKEEFAAYLCSISYMKRRWNKFRIPKLQ